jgi:hypothetical protein
VTFRATDLDIEVVDKVPAMVEQAGATTVNAVMLHEIVRKLPDGRWSRSPPMPRPDGSRSRPGGPTSRSRRCPRKIFR